MLKLVYKPMAMGVSVLGGLAASFVFKRVWKLVNGEDETPTATAQQTRLLWLPARSRRAYAYTTAAFGVGVSATAAG